MKTEMQTGIRAKSGLSGVARAIGLFLFIALLWPPPGRAGETADFLAASAEAYGPYRGAVSYLRTGNHGLAALALDEMAVRWQALCDRFRERPPAEFAADPAWRDSLDEITRRIEQARARLEAGDPKGTASVLGPIRAELGDLRRRNGIVTFSDRVDALSAAMEPLWFYRKNPPDLNDAQVILRLREQARAFKQALEKADRNLPTGTNNDAQLRRLFEGSFAGILRLERAIGERNQRFFAGTLGELRSFERLIWLNFG